MSNLSFFNVTMLYVALVVPYVIRIVLTLVKLYVALIKHLVELHVAMVLYVTLVEGLYISKAVRFISLCLKMML